MSIKEIIEEFEKLPVEARAKAALLALNNLLDAAYHEGWVDYKEIEDFMEASWRAHKS